MPTPTIKDLYGFTPGREDESSPESLPEDFAARIARAAAADQIPPLPTNLIDDIRIAQEQPLGGTRVCDTCSESFIVKHKLQKYCTTTCSRKAARNRKRHEDQKLMLRRLLRDIPHEGSER